MNEMRLVEITARAGQFRPFDLSMRSNLRQHALKTPDSAEQLRCQPHVTAKLFDKMFVTDSNLIDHVADAYWIRAAACIGKNLPPLLDRNKIRILDSFVAG